MQELLPQRPPFVMVDRLVAFDPVVTATEFLVREDCIFVENGILVPSGMVENIAQTCAARMGYINLSRGEKVKIGVIGAVNSYDIFQTPKVGEHMVTTIEVIEELFQITLVKAMIKCGEKVMAEANMKIALMDIESQD